MNKLSSFAFLSTLFLASYSLLNATCFRCDQIEAARAKEQAKNPPKLEYYDDEMRRQAEMEKKQNEPSSNSSSVISQNSSDAEKAFTKQSQDNYKNLQQSHQTMVDQDKMMFEKGTDPNQNYYPDEKKQFQNQTDKNNPYSNQEKALRGNVDAITK